MLQVFLDLQQLVELTQLIGGQLRLVQAVELLELVQQLDLVCQVVLLLVGVDVLAHDFVRHDRVEVLVLFEILILFVVLRASRPLLVEVVEILEVLAGHGQAHLHPLCLVLVLRLALVLLDRLDVGHPPRRAQRSLAILLALLLPDLLALVGGWVQLLIHVGNVPRHLLQAVELLHRTRLSLVQTSLPWEVLEAARGLLDSPVALPGVAHVPLLQVLEILLRLGLRIPRNASLNLGATLKDLRIVQILRHRLPLRWVGHHVLSHLVGRLLRFQFAELRRGQLTLATGVVDLLLVDSDLLGLHSLPGSIWIEVVGSGVFDILGGLRHLLVRIRVRLDDRVPDCADCVDEGIFEGVVDEQMLVEVQRFYQARLFDLILHSGKVLDAVAVLDLVILSRASGLPRGHRLEALHVQRCGGVHELALALDLVIEVREALQSIQLPALCLLLDHLWWENHDLGISVPVGHVRGAGVLRHLRLVGRLGFHDLASPAIVPHL